MKYLGYQPTLPIKSGDVVTILKGTPLKHGTANHIAQRTYKVKVHHVLNGIKYDDSDLAYALRQGGTSQDQNPSLCWAGKGSYWSEVDINLVPEAQ